MTTPWDNYFNRQNRYRFANSWLINAPLELTWNELINYKKWAAWCDGLEKIESLDRNSHLQKGNHIRSRWKGSLPYSITFDASIKNFVEHSFISFNVNGDLNGEGVCCFLSSRNHTTVQFKWNVSPTRLWMKMGSAFAKPAFIKNHDQILDQATTGFTQMIEQKKERLRHP